MERASTASWIVAAALAVSSCTPSMSPQSLVDKFRVIAIRATPASGTPGQEVLAEALLSDTRQGVPPSFVVWAACFPLPGQSGRQCMEGSASPDDPLGQWVFLGIESSATFTLPQLAEDEDTKEVFLVFAACAGLPVVPDCECPGPDCDACMSQFDMFDMCEDGEDAIAYKSIKVVRDEASGNRNPAIVQVLRDGEPWEPDDVPLLACPEEGCEPWTLGVEVTPESAETFTVVRFDEEVTYTEEPYVSWFATSGSFDSDRTDVGDEAPGVATVEFVPDTEDFTIKFYFVVYDGRGGVDWEERQVTTI